jgi:O-antigen/teichoic acid export membrane protein
MHSVFWLLAALGGLVALLAVGVVWAAPYWFTIVGVTPQEARIAIAVTSVTFALSLPASVFSAALYGLRRLDMVNGINILFRLGSVIPIVILLRMGGGLVAFVVLQNVLTVVRWLVEAWLAGRTGLLRNLFFPIRWNRETVRESMRYGLGNTTINISQLVSNQFDLIVIGAFLSTSWVTFFYLARTVCSYYASGISTITRTFTPHITHLHARGEHAAVLDFYLRTSRMAVLVSTWLMVGIVAYGRPFLILWMDESYVSGDFYYRTDIVMYLLISGLFFRTLQSMAYQLLLGSRELKFLTTVNVIEAAGNLGLSLLLVQNYALAGVAAGTAIPMWIIYGVVMPVYMVRKYQVGWGRYFQAVIRPVLFTCLVFGVLCWQAVSRFPPDSVVKLLVSAMAVSLIYALLAAALEFKKEERELIVSKLSLLTRRASSV